MLEPEIAAFFEEKKAAWLKKKISSNSSDDEVAERENECEEIFSLVNWLPDAARRAKQLTMVTHPGKFSHPSAKTSGIIADKTFNADGFLRSGNAHAETDVLGNAAALDVYKFLSIKLSDGKTVLQHLQEETELAKQQLAIKSCDFSELKHGFMAIKDNDAKAFTSDIVKQVYFPVHDDYHLLSILTPSGLVFEMKKRIDRIRFSDASKEAREARRNEKTHDQGYDDILQLTVVGYGGTKPQNISVINSQNGGKAYLLSSLPPEVTPREIRLPKHNFFVESFRYKDCRDILSSLHGLFALETNNKPVRDKISLRYAEFVDRVVQRMWQVRMAQQSPDYHADFSGLPLHQRTWLDSDYQHQRETDDQWLDTLVNDLARWLVTAYKKTMGKQAFTVADAELAHIKQQIDNNREALR